MRNWNSKIEQLVALKAVIAGLQKKAKVIEGEFKVEAIDEGQGTGVWEGSQHTLRVAKVDSWPVDWKALCEELKPSQYYIKKHTGYASTLRLTVSVKKKEAA